MGRNSGRLNDDETVQKRSGWLIPLGVFGVTFVLSAALLFYYLAPSRSGLFEEQIAPTSRSDIVSLSVAGSRFRVPANYLIYNSTRTGGERNEIAMHALLPDLSGWSNWAADAFSSNAPDARVVYLTIRKARIGLKDADRLVRVYFDYTTDRRGFDGPYGLRQYVFRKDSGYRDQYLLVGQTANGPVILLCVKLSDQVPSPSCLHETQLAPGVGLSIRFKRAHLKDWLDIVAKANRLVAGFGRPELRQSTAAKP